MPISSLLPRLDAPSIPFHDYFFKFIKQYGDNIAMINHTTKETFTFENLIQKSKFIATALVNLGVEKGEVVVLCMGNSPEAVYIFMGVSLAGAVASTISPRLHAEEMKDQLLATETRFLFVDPLGLDSVDKVFEENIKDHRIICTGTRDSSNGYPILADLTHAGNQRVKFPPIYPHDDMVYLPFSSGIHGDRKGIITTHYIMNLKTIAAYNPRCYLQPSKGGYTLAMLPFNKQMGLETTLISLMNGSTVLTVEGNCISTFLECIEAYKVRTLNLSPMLMSLMKREAEKSEYKITSLFTVISGTASVTEGLYDDFRATFPSVKYIVTSYGMTETGMITRSLPLAQYSSSCGILAAGMELKVCDLTSGEELEATEKGLILVRGPTTSCPYLNNDEATHESFINGWRKTGDIGYYDEQGNVYLVDKSKEMIKVHGFQVIPTELEALLLTHPAIKEAAVVPIEDQDSGERPVAFVVLEPGHLVTTKQIMEYVNERVVRFKRIVQVNIAQTLPRSPCGSPLRRLLAEAAILNINNLS